MDFLGETFGHDTNTSRQIVKSFAALTMMDWEQDLLTFTFGQIYDTWKLGDSCTCSYLFRRTW